MLLRHNKPIVANASRKADSRPLIQIAHAAASRKAGRGGASPALLRAHALRRHARTPIASTAALNYDGAYLEAARRETLSRAIASTRDWRQLLTLVNRHGRELDGAQAEAALERAVRLLERAPLRSSYEAQQAQALYDWLRRRVAEEQEAAAEQAARLQEEQQQRMRLALEQQRQQQQRQQQLEQQRLLQQQQEQQRRQQEQLQRMKQEQQLQQQQFLAQRQQQQAQRATLDASDERLRAALAAGVLPRGVRAADLDAFLGREVRRAAAGGGGGPAVVDTVRRYAALMDARHAALALEQLAAVYGALGGAQEAEAEDEEELEACAAAVFEAARPMAARATAGGVAALIGAMADLRLYDERLLVAVLNRAAAQMAAFDMGDLSWTLHSLAELGVRPPPAWLSAASARAAALARGAGLADLERAASALALMRHAPGPAFCAAAEERVEQLARGGAPREAAEQETLLAAIKALSLLGAPNARRWYAELVPSSGGTAAPDARPSTPDGTQQAAKRSEQERRSAAARARAEQLQQQQERQHEEQERRERRLQQEQLEQAALRERERRKALRQQQQQQQQQQPQKQQQAQTDGSSKRRGSKQGAAGHAAPGLVSVDDLYTRALGADGPGGQGAGGNDDNLLHLLDAAGGLSMREVASDGGASGSGSGKADPPAQQANKQQATQQQPQQKQKQKPAVQAVEPAIWSVEQRARWNERPSAAGGLGASDEAPATASAREAAAAASAAGARTSGPPLGSSGAAPFVAAAKALRAKQVNRTLLSGCIEAAQQELDDARQALLARQLRRELGSGGSGSGSGSDADDPYARLACQLLEDLARARQRAEDDRRGAAAAAAADVVAKWLPLLDSFDAAQAAAAAAEAREGPPPHGEAQIHATYAALRAQLLSLLGKAGVTVLGSEQEGAAFDPAVHEAVMRQPLPLGSGLRDGDVVTVLRPGYRCGERLLRPALVAVAQE